MNNTKRESLDKVSTSTKAKSYQAIKQALYANGPLSRSQLAEVTNLRVSSICARVSELIKLGELAEVGTTYDKSTERNVKVVALATQKVAV